MRDSKIFNVPISEQDALREEIQNLRAEIKNLAESFSQLQISIDAQKINHRMYFDSVENSLAALKILLENTLSPKISAVEKSIAAESQNNSLISKNLSSLEELMRLLVANQMLNQIEIQPPPKPEKTTVTDTPSKKSVTDTPKKIYVHGRAEINSTAGLQSQLFLTSGYIQKGDRLKIGNSESFVRRVFDNYYTETYKVETRGICYVEADSINLTYFSIGSKIEFF